MSDIGELEKRIYRQYSTKRGYEFFIDSIPYRVGKCAGRVWIDKRKGLSRQCSRSVYPCMGEGYFCKQHKANELV